jgi:hypothetical protein
MAVPAPNKSQFYAISMATLANTTLSSVADRPVLYKTGMTGNYDLRPQATNSAFWGYDKPRDPASGRLRNSRRRRIDRPRQTVMFGLFRSRQMLLQFRQHLVDFSPFRHGRGLGIVSDRELVMFTDGLQHLKHFRVLLFRQKIYLEIKMVSLIRLNIAAVLAHEDEQREEDRFQGYDRGQKLVRKRVEGELALGSAVEPEPDREPHQVEYYEPHFPCVRGDGVAYTGREGSIRQRTVFKFGDCLNVAGSSRRSRLHTSMLFGGGHAKTM